MRLPLAALASSLACAGCSDGGTFVRVDPFDALACDAQVDLTFTPDAPEPGDEAYVCFDFDPAKVAFLRGIRWSPPEGTERSVVLHHAVLFASTRAPAADRATYPCDAMDGATQLHAWAPGAGSLVLPANVAVALPEGTRALTVQAHALRTSLGQARAAQATLCATSAAPAHRAIWLSAWAPVPPIPPHGDAASTATCRASAPMHLLTSRPHMHRAGRAIRAEIDRGGARSLLVDVSRFDFDDQRTYPIDVAIAAGDGVATTCTWSNPGDVTIVGGPRSTDEMCHQNLIVWPAEAARWDGPCR